MCAGCSKESNRAGDEEEIHAKNVPGRDPEIGTNAQNQVNSLRGSGQPLAGSLRAFFEPRFWYDFSRVRVHTSHRAAEAARSVNALAYTKENDIVFGQGQYRPGTESGGKLLAHELAHVVQQGAANAPMQAQRSILRRSSDPPSLQRQGDPSQAPSSMSCPIANTSSAQSVVTDVLFSLGTATLTPAAIIDLGSFVVSWTAAGANRDVRVDGFASIDGQQALNWTLSCDRAVAVAAELENPSSGAPGIPNQFLEVLANGETTQFGAALPPNRRATVSADLAQPACANPGVSRSLDLQPVFLRTDPTDAAPTGGSWTRRFNESNAIWGKLGVMFVELTPITIDTPLKTSGGTAAEISSIAALRTSAGVEIFVVDNDLTTSGGSVTLGPLAPLCTTGKMVMSDRGTSDTLLAHELGHILGIQHPGVPPNPGEAGTIMVGSGSHSTANSTRNTLGNNVLCPPGTGSTCLNPDP
jgi:outer membrane protein OmpA-like peptidoglycan-associated protein